MAEIHSKLQEVYGQSHALDPVKGLLVDLRYSCSCDMCASGS